MKDFAMAWARQSILLTSCSGAVILGSAGATLAQTAPIQASAPVEVGEVVVTAQRRVENLQEVPISAEVVGGKALQTQNVNSLVDMALETPSIRIDSSFNVNDIYIRGIGSGGNQSFDQSVSVFVDDVYHGRSRISGATFLDLDRVEVLKGPQSTFFGNNAIAGAIDVVTAKPGPDFSGWARALYGQYGQYALEGATNIPISDTLFARVAFTTNGQSGWVKNINADKEGPSADNIAGRAKFLWKPTDDFDATLKIDASRNRTSGAAFQIGACPPPAPYTTAGFCTLALATGVPIGFDMSQNSLLPGQLSRLITNDDTLTLNYVRWGHTFTSVSAYLDYDYTGTEDIVAVPSQQFTTSVPERYHQFSQEFRVSSPSGQTIEYLAGLYYQTDKLHFDREYNYFYLTPKILGVPALAALSPYLPLGQDIASAQNEDQESVFASATWNATDKLKISGGLRGSWVHKDYVWNEIYGTAGQSYGGLTGLPASVAALPAALGTGTPGTLAAKRSDHAVMPSVRVQYQIEPSVMAYASYARGFKEGGFNGADNMANGLSAPELLFAPEHVDAYEAGLKSEWFEHRLRLNLTVFLSKYDDLQVSQSRQTPSGAYISIVGNNAFAQSAGAEFEGQWVLNDAFTLRTNVTYDDSHYTSYDGVALTDIQNFCGSAANKANSACVSAFGGQYLQKFQSLTGEPTPLAPKWAADLVADYHTTLPNGFGFVAQVSDSFSSSYFTNTGLDDPYLHPKSSQRIDARLSLTLPDRHLSVDLIGKNLNDGTSYSAYNNLPSSTGAIIYARNQPRNVALQIRYNW